MPGAISHEGKLLFTLADPVTVLKDTDKPYDGLKVYVVEEVSNLEEFISAEFESVE